MLKTFGANTFACLVFRAIAGARANSAPSVTYQIVRIGDTIQVSVRSVLPNVAWYCWYIDGAFVGKSKGPTKSFQVPAGEQFRLECVPTADEDFDPIAGAPTGYPARRTLWWVRSLATNAASYRVDQREGDGDWAIIGLVAEEDARWNYWFLTDRLNDLTQYTWRVVAIDAAGNEAEPTLIGPEKVVRLPDAPDFTVDFDAETRAVEFAVT